MQPTTPSPGLHQYACIRCRARKVRCNRTIAGCANCAGVGAKCTYSARRPRKNLRSHQAVATPRPIVPSETTTLGIRNGRDFDHPDRVCDGSSSRCVEDEQAEAEDDVLIPREVRDSLFEARYDSKPSTQGRLFTTQGKSRYINSIKVDQVRVNSSL